MMSAPSSSGASRPIMWATSGMSTARASGAVGREVLGGGGGEREVERTGDGEHRRAKLPEARRGRRLEADRPAGQAAAADGWHGPSRARPRGCPRARDRRADPGHRPRLARQRRRWRRHHPCLRVARARHPTASSAGVCSGNQPLMLAADGDHGDDPVGILDGRVHGDLAADGVAHQRGPPQPQGIHDRDGVGAVGVGHVLGVAESPQCRAGRTPPRGSRPRAGTASAAPTPRKSTMSAWSRTMGGPSPEVVDRRGAHRARRRSAQTWPECVMPPT